MGQVVLGAETIPLLCLLVSRHLVRPVVWRCTRSHPASSCSRWWWVVAVSVVVVVWGSGVVRT